MKRFKSLVQAQWVLAVRGQVAKQFGRLANLSNADHRRHRAQACQTCAAGPMQPKPSEADMPSPWCGRSSRN